MLVCTTVTRRTIAFARRLYRSLSRHNPDTPMIALLLDDRELAFDSHDEPFTLIRPAELGIDRFELLAARLPEGRLARATQPSLLRLALDRSPDGSVIYLAAQTEVFAELDPLAGLAADHGFALVPRLTEPVPFDGLSPTDVDVLRSGIFDPGCLACNSSERVTKLLRSWSQRLRHSGLADAATAYLRWSDLLVTLAPEAAVVNDRGTGVSVWNLHERRLAEENGTITVDGERLRTLSFAGLGDGANIARPEATTEDEMLTRGDALVSRNPILARLATERNTWLDAAAAHDGRTYEYGFARLADGTPLSAQLREWIRLAERHGFRPDPFSAEGTAALLEWLRTPTEVGLEHGIPRFWLFVRATRGDLGATFPDLDGPDGARFVQWIVETGEREYEIPPALRITSGALRTA